MNGNNSDRRTKMQGTVRYQYSIIFLLNAAVTIWYQNLD